MPLHCEFKSESRFASAHTIFGLFAGFLLGSSYLFAGHGGRQEDVAQLPSIPVQRGAAVAERDGLEPGESVATTGTAEEDQPLVPYQLAAATRENRPMFGQARPVRLAPVGGEPSDAAALWKHAGEDRRATTATRVGEP